MSIVFSSSARPRSARFGGLLRGITGAAAALLVACAPASAFRIELKDVAPDRIERQRAEAIGQLPLPGTPNVAQMAERLADKGLAVGSAMFIRVFKAESELEVWMQKGDRFELFATYPICHWSGTLGPKVSEGDKQSPEGVYTVTQRQLHMIGRHPRSLNLGFPNALDKQFQRTGSYILIHGGCGSVGCFAMTNPVIEEIFSLAQAALKNGQDAIQVHAFPFRMTEDNMRAFALHDWYDFWRNLKDVYDNFEQTRRLARVSVCEGRYWIDTGGEREVASHGPLAVCGKAPVEALPNSETDAANPTEVAWRPLPQPSPTGSPPFSLTGPPSRLLLSPSLSQLRPLQPQLSSNRSSPASPSSTPSRHSPGDASAKHVAGMAGTPAASPKSTTSTSIVRPTCELTLASCRKWVALKTAIVERKVAAQQKRGIKTAQAIRRP